MRRALMVALGAWVLLHVLFPSRVTMDWPSIGLAGIFVCLMFWPSVERLLPLIRRLKIGNTEVETWESLGKLWKHVEQAEDNPPVRTAGARRNQRERSVERSPTQDILALASHNREIAVMQIAMEIEKALANLYLQEGLGDEPPHTIRKTLDELTSRQILPEELGQAVIEFRDVRNKIAHPIRGLVVDEVALTSAVDSGIRILDLLLRLQKS